MTIAEATEYLGIGSKKMAALLKSGELPYQPDKLDRRIKLVKRADVETLKEQSRKNAA
jgi:excisionase family DNA binding protein